ncbi:MAG TPA: YciI family protein [Polyangiaceae bacterium]|nr:YciI family protein [Polyangiaceae bacterium]
MAKYALLLGGADLDKRSGNAALAPKMFERFSSWLGSLRESGRYIGSHKLLDQTGARLSVRGGQVVEGPFMETKEAVGGVVLIEAGSLEEAIAIARECPTLDLQNGHVEVRVIEEVRHPGHA